MKVGAFSEADEWTTNGQKINASENLKTVKNTLENSGPIIVEHRFYRGAKAPGRLVFDDFEAFNDYLNTETKAGDSIYVWSFAETCTSQNVLASGKCPDNQGRIPKGGAY